MKLNIELIPKTSWGRNCRSILKPKNWNKIRFHLYEKHNHKCQICHKQGKKHPVECHEVWSYNFKNKTQKLTSLEILCPTCHQVKHIGRTIMTPTKSKKHKKFKLKILKHFRKINKISKSKSIKKINEAFWINNNRSSVKWKINIKLARKLLKKI